MALVAGLWLDPVTSKGLSTPSPTSDPLLLAEQGYDEEAVIDQGKWCSTASVRYENELEGEAVLRAWQRSHQPSAFSHGTKVVLPPGSGCTALATSAASRALQVLLLLQSTVPWTWGRGDW